MAKRKGNRKTVTRILYLPEKLREYKVEFVTNRELLKLRKNDADCSVRYNKKKEAIGCEDHGCAGGCSGPNLIVFFDSEGAHSYYVCSCIT